MFENIYKKSSIITGEVCGKVTEQMSPVGTQELLTKADNEHFKSKWGFDKLRFTVRYKESKRPFIILDGSKFRQDSSGVYHYDDPNDTTGLEISYNIVPFRNCNGEKEMSVLITSSLLDEEERCKLIGEETILSCFRNLSKKGIICLTAPQYIIRCAEVTRMDITADKYATYEFIGLFEQFTSFNFKNYKRNVLVLPCYPDHNMIMSNRDEKKKSKHKKRMIIYYKHRQLQNMKRYQSLSDYYVDSFKDKYRIEINLYTEAQIRSMFGFMDSHTVTLEDVLTTPVQPFLPLYSHFVNLDGDVVDLSPQNRKKNNDIYSL